MTIIPLFRYKGLALHIAVACIAAAAVTWMGVSSLWPSSSVGRVPARFRSPATANEVGAALGSLGLTPKILAAAGFTPEQTSTFAGAAAGELRSRIAPYRMAAAAVGEAGNEVNRLERQIRSGQGSPETVTALATAKANLETAKAQRQAILDDALAEGADGLNQQQLATLTTFRLRTQTWDLPERYLGDERSEAQWVELRDALANLRIAARANQEPDPAAAQIVQAANATLRSVAAATNLENLAQITAAWNAAMGE